MRFCANISEDKFTFEFTGEEIRALKGGEDISDTSELILAAAKAYIKYGPKKFVLGADRTPLVFPFKVDGDDLVAEHIAL